LYAWQTETSNYEYKLFLKAMMNENIDKYSTYLLDTFKWTQAQIARYQAPVISMEHTYHKHVAFNSHPLVNVSYENALAYCDWLTQKYNSDNARKFKKVIFTLPTLNEWTYAASSGDKAIFYSWKGKDVKDKNGKYFCNIRQVEEHLLFKDSTSNKLVIQNPYYDGYEYPFYTTNTLSYKPNSFGLYNCTGNVNEMTIEKRIAKGGSYNSYGGEATISFTHYYQSSSPDLGFRVFMKVMEE
jgi:formylglycine-generating enzyme